jgi:mono/diheme cytochrome c family protein/azurin
VSGGSKALLAAGAALALAAAGCGSTEEPDEVNGKDLFAQKCGSCHTLARANTKGVQGPNLDQAFGAARRDGLGEGTVEGVVLRQIGNVRRTSKMPPDLVEGQDARDVAAYVAAVAGQPGKDAGALASAGQPKVSNKPIAAKNGVLTMDADATGALAFASTKATAPAGALEFVMGNESSVQHNIALEGDGEGPVVGQGGSSKFKANVKPGEYVYLCTVPGHADGGMKGTLTVK